MNNELDLLQSLRRAFERAGQGMGMARALVVELGRMRRPGSDVARMLLLGFPLRPSLSPLQGGSDEVAMLSSLVASAPKSSTPLVGRSGESLSITLERWIKQRENRKMEQRVLWFRSLVSSGVMGAVAAMVASLGPLLGNLDFSGAAPVSGGYLLLAAGCMTAVSSSMLGLLMSGRRFYVNGAISAAVFVVVAALASPLAAVPSISLWGVK